MHGTRNPRAGVAAAAFSLCVLAAGCGSQLSAVQATVSVPVPPIPVSQPAPAQLQSLSMTSPKQGAGLFTRPGGAACQVVSGRTADGGARFTAPAPVGVCGSVQYIAAAGQGTLLAYGPDLYIQSGPAGPWRKSPQPGTVLALSAAGRSVWLLLARCHGTQVTAAGCALALELSADGGRTWSAAGALPADAVTAGGVSGPALSGPAAGQTWLVRTGASAGYVVAAPAPGAAGRPDPAPVWYTADAGATWSQRSVSCGIDALSVSLAAAPDGTLAAVCAAEPSAGSQPKATATSADGGVHWLVRPGCPQARPCGSALDGGYLGQVAAVSAQTFYLVGDRSPLLVSTDGGAVWQAVRPAVGDASAGSSQLQFFGGSRGVVVAAGGSPDGSWDVFATSDAGRTWSRRVPQLAP